MTKEERQIKREARKQKYYSLRNDLESISWKLRDLESTRGHTPAFKTLKYSVRVMLEQIKSDYARYENVLDNKDYRDEMVELQQALNRANVKNAELEKEIAEAKTSSGLFIKFVRDKLGI